MDCTSEDDDPTETKEADKYGSSLTRSVETTVYLIRVYYAEAMLVRGRTTDDEVTPALS